MEYMLSQYKLIFNADSEIYKNKTKEEIQAHYRFNKSYKSIIKVDIIQSLSLEGICSDKKNFE